MTAKIFLKQYIKMFVQNCMLPVCYNWFRRGKTEKNLVVFADAHHASRPENMQRLYEYLQERTELNIQELYLDYQSASFGQVFHHMLQFMKLYARAESVVICDNFLPAASCRKREETRVIQLWHACGAFKKFGYDTEDDIPKNYRGNVFQNTDLVTVSAECCVKPFASAMRLPEDHVRPYGVCRTDVYFDETWRADCRREFYDAYPEAVGKKIVLWAPTFRGNPGDPESIGLNVKALQKRLGEEWLVLTRVHPHMMKKYGKDNCRIQTERLFPVVDVLIADYSSLIFEYLLFHKPMVLYTPDFQEYTKDRGFYLDFKEIPGCQVTEEAILPEAVVQAFASGSSDKETAFLQRYMSGCDGHAAERVANYILRQEEEIIPR